MIFGPLSRGCADADYPSFVFLRIKIHQLSILIELHRAQMLHSDQIAEYFHGTVNIEHQRGISSILLRSINHGDRFPLFRISNEKSWRSDLSRSIVAVKNRCYAVDFARLSLCSTPLLTHVRAPQMP